MTPSEAMHKLATAAAPPPPPSGGATHGELRPSELAADPTAISSAKRALEQGGSLLISGPPGSGKSTTIASLTRAMGESPVFLDAAELTPPMIQTAVQGAGAGSMGARARVIIENCEARGAASAIAAAIRSSGAVANVVAIVTDRYGSPGSTLARAVRHDVRFPPISDARMNWALGRAARMHGWRCDASHVRAASSRGRGDLRAALHALRWVSIDTANDVATGNGPGQLREARDSFEAATRVLNPQTDTDRAVSGVERLVNTDRAVVLAHAAHTGYTRKGCTLATAARLASALSDEDAAGFASECGIAAALAARRCWSRSHRGDRVKRFPPTESFGAMPRRSSGQRELSRALGAHSRGHGAAMEVGRMACSMATGAGAQRSRKRARVDRLSLSREAVTAGQRTLSLGGRPAPVTIRAAVNIARMNHALE